MQKKVIASLPIPIPNYKESYGYQRYCEKKFQIKMIVSEMIEKVLGEEPNILKEHELWETEMYYSGPLGEALRQQDQIREERERKCRAFLHGE